MPRIARELVTKVLENILLRPEDQFLKADIAAALQAIPEQNLSPEVKIDVEKGVTGVGAVEQLDAILKQFRNDNGA